MTTAILVAIAGAAIIGLFTLALLKRQPRGARTAHSGSSGDVSWMHAGSTDGCDSGGGDGGGGCDGGGGGGGD